MPPLLGDPPAAPRREPLHPQREQLHEPHPAAAPSIFPKRKHETQRPPPTSLAEGHATLHRSDVLGVWSSSQSDVRGAAQLGRGALPRPAGFFLRALCSVTLHSGVSVLANERREREVGQRAPPRERDREKYELQSAWVHLAVWSRPLHCSAKSGRAPEIKYHYSSLTIL